MFHSLFRKGFAVNNKTSNNLIKLYNCRQQTDATRQLIASPSRLASPSSLIIASPQVRQYAIKVNKDGTAKTATTTTAAPSSAKPLKNKPSKKKSATTSASVQPAQEQQQQQQQQFQYLNIQTKKEQQAENLQQLMRMLIMIDEQERVHNELGSADHSSDNNNQNSASVGSLDNHQNMDFDSSMNYMVTYQFFRNMVAYKNWWVSSSISHQHTPGEAFSGLNIIIRAFSDQKQFAEYKNSLSLRGKSGKDERAMKVENMAQFIECVLLNEQVGREKDESKKRELQEQLGKSPYASMVAFIPPGVSKMVIDDGSSHAFTLEKQYFQPIIKWRSIQFIESAIHCIRLWALPKTARNNYDNSVYLEEEVDEDPIQALLDYDRFFTIRKPNGAWILIPEREAATTIETGEASSPKNTHIPIFTAPDLAYQFADENDIDHSQVKIMSGSKLFHMLNQAYDKIEGIVVNAGNLHPHSINQEVTFTKEFIRAVAEADNEEDDE